MNRLRRRVENLERRTGAVLLTPEEEAAIASDQPCWPISGIAMAKICARYGLEALVLASFVPRPAS